MSQGVKEIVCYHVRLTIEHHSATHKSRYCANSGCRVKQGCLMVQQV